MAHEIQFYIKKPNQEQTLSDLILSLNTQGIYIHTNNHDHAEAISQILWTYPKDRFIANIITKPCPDAVIAIGYNAIPNNRKTIINCSNSLIERTHIEWVIDQANNVGLARERYKHWRQQGHSLSFIKADN